ncbi:MAG TPA: plastocyanin/azurin family copper-binding protein [Gemmatimonadaceae bacterium]|jgi:plastocyanin|nr:plastocyanin/azurin family copper-binding protein [Gemmatimonadaceae bacterium]
MKGVFVVMAVAALSACGGGGGSSSTAPNNNPGINTPPAVDGISVTNNAFSPGTKTVSAGTTVKWAWNSCTGDSYSGQICAEHSVTFDDGSGSAIQDTGTFSKTFNTPGVYNYHCSVHGAVMSGSITVQ